MTTYAYSTPIILTDEIYSDYGGQLDNTTDSQRDAAYLISEMQLSSELETYLLPTIVTGTYLYNPLDKFLILEHSHVQRIIRTRFIDIEEYAYWSQAGTDNIYFSLRDGERGLVDIHSILGNYSCNHSYMYPYKIEEVYEAGLPTGTANKPDILLALTTYANIVLNEIIGYGNESSGDIGVQQFSNQNYSESRVKLLRTSFGTSARAQFIKKLIGKYIRKRWIQL